MREKLNCPNCGAPITGTVCKYCGAVFYDFAVLDAERPTYVRIKYRGSINVFRAILSGFTFEMTNEPLVYMDNQPVLLMPEIADATLDLSMRIVPDDRGVYLCRKELKQEGDDNARQ